MASAVEWQPVASAKVVSIMVRNSSRFATPVFARLKAFRRKRDGKVSGAAIARLAKAAKAPKENLFPHILNAVESRATLGEIFGTLREVFGEHHAR